MATMLEFAIVIGLKRFLSLKQEMKIRSEPGMERMVTFDIDMLTSKFDVMSLVIIFVCYFIFNVSYWAYYLK